jgi:hypothetical protein
LSGGSVKRARPWILVAGALLTAILAYLAREAVHDFIVLPLAYGVWQLRGLLAGVAQLVQWGLLVVAMGLVMAWQLIPRLAPPSGRTPRRPASVGPVSATAIALVRARSSNYFRWQLAHRLGRAARTLGDVPSRSLQVGNASAAIADYLDAGLNRSFVDYASPKSLFGRPEKGPLGIDPEEVVQYLESHLTPGGGSHVESR